METIGKIEGTGSTQQAGARADDELISPWPRKVLLACDGSKHSAKAANIVAAMVSPGSKVRVITVQSYEFAAYTGEWGPLSDEPERQERLRSIIRQVFREPLELLKKSSCEVERTSRLGNPAEQILEEVGEWHPDLLVVGRAGMGGMSRLLLGSVSTHLVKHTPVPILVVP
ncbi:MAG TPA: universal stress protein [Actinomycetota bacterium]|jgi:nucleotide-binding universal stress UspA family protein|nr:universal stress protein [Actinomycetota bacterium]